MTELVLSPTDTCLQVTHTDWPTREDDITCSQRAVYVCQSPGCEMPLCAVHMEHCDDCNTTLCEGCLDVHNCGVWA